MFNIVCVLKQYILAMLGYIKYIIKIDLGIFLVVQWLRLCASTAGGVGLIPSWGTKILHVMRHGYIYITIFPQAPQKEFSLRNMYVRGTLCFMLQAKWTPEMPCLEGSPNFPAEASCMLIVHITR